MAKEFLLSVLVDTLGKYVDGLSVENLKVGVWSGKIELKNLKLKQTALDNLNLPINIKHGRLTNLVVKIPWIGLESTPVRVEIDGVYLLASPIDLLTISREAINKSNFADKLKTLKRSEDIVIDSGKVEDIDDIKEQTKNASYIQKVIFITYLIYLF
jgi:vacuolar protein sorting-associated protein 13A/C